MTKFEEIPLWAVQLMIGSVIAALLGVIIKMWIDSYIEKKEAPV